MILNHKAAIEMLVEQAGEIGFNRYTVQNLHALLADNLLPDAAAGGRLRRVDVAIAGSVYQPLAVPQQIEEHFDTLLAKAQAIEDPFRSEEHTTELQSLMRNSYAVFCLKKKKKNQ